MGMLMDSMIEDFKKSLEKNLFEVLCKKVKEFETKMNEERPNFTIFSLDEFIDFLKDTRWSDLDNFCEKNPEFGVARREMLKEFGKGYYGFNDNYLLDFSNLNKSDIEMLHESWTYFEDNKDLNKTHKKILMMDDMIEGRPQSIEEAVKHSLFDPINGKARKTKEYEYVGDGYAKNLKTGKIFFAVKKY